jgi:hypothetical protein
VAIRDGRTSTEIVRRRSYREDLEELDRSAENSAERQEDEDFIHEELVVLDRSGRLQLPKDYMDSMGIKGGDRVKMEFDEDDKKLYIIRSD